MARTKLGEPYPLTVFDLRGGRNGFDPPLMIPDDQCLEALNVDGWEGSLANKRSGASTIGITFSSGGPFGGRIVSLLRHVPSSDETAAEFWAVDTTGVTGRLAGAATWVDKTPSDTISTPAEVLGASLGGFFHLAYDSTQNRSHVWDPSLAKIRRTGLATPAAPTTAALGAGGLSFSRYYRVRYSDVSGTTVRRVSEASPATSVVTIAAKAGVTITKPAAISEDEVAWRIEASDSATGPWYQLQTQVVGTTTYDDVNATIPTTILSALDGINTPPPSWKYIGTDDNRIYGAGCWETTGGFTTANAARFWFTPVLGSTDVGDAERVPVGNFVGLEETPTAVSRKPFQGAVWVFGNSRIWKMVPTGVATAPYQKFTIRSDVGCIHQQSLVEADDENGSPCLYWLTRKGPYRLGANGFQYLGADIEDLWALVSLSATPQPHGVYHADKHQIWWWISSGVKVVFDTKAGRTINADAVRKGWYQHTGDSAKAHCSCMFSGTIGITMSLALKPYIGYVTSTALYECDTNTTDDNGVAFQAYVDTKEYGTIGRNHAVSEGVLIGNVATGVTITVKVFSDFSLDSAASGTALLTAAGTETAVQKRLDGLQTAGIGTFRFRIGDSAAVANGWILNAFLTNVTEQERKSG